jgi:hypothetical protein
MKAFRYVCRGQAGTLKNGSLRAADRADALRQIKAMGCVPVSVAEGKTAAPRAARSPAWNRAAWLAAAGVALAAGLVAWRLADRHPVAGSLVSDRPRLSPTSPARPAASPAPGEGTAQPVRAVSLSGTPSRETPPASHPQTGTSPRPQGQAPLPPQPAAADVAPEEKQRLRHPNPFKSSTEQLLAMAMSVPPGAMIPPLPIARDLDGDFAGALANMIVIYDDDDERTAQTKENVAVAKEQLRELVTQGRSVADALKEYQDTVNERAEIRQKAQAELNALHKNGKPQEAKAYLDEINAALQTLDIEPISLPQPRKKR